MEQEARKGLEVPQGIPGRKSTAIPAVLIPAAFFALAYLAPLNGGGLWHPDETRYAEISREMVSSGDWVVPRLLGIRYFEKPVAGYWINSLSQMLLGESNFSVRFGSALCTGLSAVLVYCLAMLLWSERATALAAALIYLSMLLVAGLGTYSVLDPMLTLWMAAALLCSQLCLRAGTRQGRGGAYILLGLACGMGFLTKGFVALAVPAAASLPVFIRQRRFTELLCYGPLAVASAALISLPWSLLIAWREPDYWRYFFWEEHIRRFAGENAQHSEPFWFYLPCLLAGSVPWLGLVPDALRRGWQGRLARPELFFLLSWTLMPLFLFSMAKGKLMTYILPCMAPLALLLARYGRDSACSGRMRFLKLNGIINAGISLAGLLALAVLFLGLFPNLPRFAPEEWMKPVLCGLALAFWGLMAALSLARNSRFWLLAAACPLLAALVAGFVLPETAMINGKPPQAFMRKNMEILKGSRFILANDVGMASAMAWELKRDDVTMVHSAGELAYGLRYLDSRDRLLRPGELADWIGRARREGNVVMLLRVPRENVEPPPYAPPAEAVLRFDRYVMLLYAQRSY